MARPPASWPTLENYNARIDTLTELRKAVSEEKMGIAYELRAAQDEMVKLKARIRELESKVALFESAAAAAATPAAEQIAKLTWERDVARRACQTLQRQPQRVTSASRPSRPASPVTKRPRHDGDH